MELVNINNTYDENDKPRYLTDEEINLILDYLPETFSADVAEGEMIRESIANALREQLQNKKLAPSAINSTANEIVKYHNTSRIAAASDVGAWAAEGSSAAPMQATLNSIAPYEQILIQDEDGTGHIYEIGTWIDNLLENNKEEIEHIPENRTQYLELKKPVLIASCNEDGIVTWDKLTAITKHLPVGDLVKIKTKSGREVTATQNKSLLAWNGSKILQVKGKNIKVGDLVPIMNEIPTPEKVYDVLDLKYYLSPKEWLYKSELYKVNQDYENNIVQLTNGKFAAPRGFWQDKLENVPYSRGDALIEAIRDMRKHGIFNDDDYIYPKFWAHNSKIEVPVKLPMNKLFGQFVGLYLADGWCTETFIGISKNAPEIRQIVYDWCDSMNIGYHLTHNETAMGTQNDVKIHSVLFARFFKQWMGTGSAKKIMPQEILFGNEEFIKGVLDGYFAGDGTVRKTDGSLVISSVSKPLIIGTSFLCSRLGIFGKISGRQQSYNNLGTQNILYMNEFSIRNFNADLWRDIIGSCNIEKYKLMNQKYKRLAKWGNGYMKHNNIMLDPVVSIEYVKDIEYVYDVTVPSTLNFSLLNGLGLADSFHFAGSSRAAGGGFATFEELFYTKKHKKNEICTIHYKDKTLSYEQVLETKEKIVGCVISDFVQDYLYVKEGSGYVKDYTIDMYQNLDKLWWHNDYYITNILESKIPPNDAFVLRIKLNIKEMFKFKVSIQDLVNTFKREYESPISLIYGPIADGIIDIYACAKYTKNKEKTELEAVDCEEVDNTTENDMINAAFYQSIIIPSLSTLRVKGVLGIRDLIPIVTPVVSIIQKDDDVRWMVDVLDTASLKLLDMLGIKIDHSDEYDLLTMPNYDDIDYLFELTKEEYLLLSPLEYLNQVIKADKKENPKSKQTNLLKTYKTLYGLTWQKVYLVLLSYRRSKSSGISTDILKKLFNMVNIEILYETKVNLNTQLIVKLNEAITPRGLILKLLKIDEAEQKSTRGPYSPLMRAAEVIHSEVMGTNLRGLMGLNFLDQERLMSNNLHIVSSVLGNRASRALFIKDLSLAMASHGLHPQHIITVADVFFCRGIPTGAMTSSVNKQLGPIDKASVSKAIEVFKGSSLHGVNHEISGISTNIAFGIAPKVGTGYMDVGYEVKGNIVTNEAVYTAFKHERAYIDRNAKESVPVETENINEDIKETLRPKAPLGKKVVIEAKTPVSKYQKSVEKEVEAFLKPQESKVPVSKYQKPIIEEIPKVPTSKYQKKPIIEEIPKSVSKYQKNPDISKKTIRKK